jgi:hypothetical protein
MKKQIIIFLREDDLLTSLVKQIVREYCGTNDFIFTNDAKYVKELVRDGTSQLVIMNSLRAGDTSAVGPYIDELKERSKSVLVANFSSFPVDDGANFDYTISRNAGEWIPSLRHAIELFLADRVIRKEKLEHLPVAA